jgi:hypothetical protein
MSQQQGTISPNDLMTRLVQAKKVMNKVETGNFEKGYVNEQILKSNPEDLVNVQNVQPSTRPVGQNLNVDKINSSKLPDAIKRAMIESPIPQITLNDNINMDFIQGAKKLMEKEGLTKKSTQKLQENHQNYSNIDMNSLSTLIENTIRKVLDEKLNQILTAQQTATINENLVLKVGDSIFRGKITGVNKAK